MLGVAVLGSGPFISVGSFNTSIYPVYAVGTFS
jgi:hypothetical protein